MTANNRYFDKMIRSDLNSFSVPVKLDDTECLMLICETGSCMESWPLAGINYDGCK
jgi:hypothetical protein